MRHSESLTNIAPAIVDALAEIEGAVKGANNGHFKTKYADLTSVIEASKDTLAKHGLALMQFPGGMQGSAMTLETVFLHKSGEWLTGSEAFGIALGKVDPQGVGSALTYARRYAQMSALNMPAVDDDGEAAAGRPQAPKPANQARVPSGLSVHAEGKDWWNCDGFGPSAAQAKRDGLGEIAADLKNEITALTSASEWREWCRQNTDRIRPMPQSWRVELRNHAEAIAIELGVDLNTREAA